MAAGHCSRSGCLPPGRWGQNRTAVRHLLILIHTCRSPFTGAFVRYERLSRYYRDQDCYRVRLSGSAATLFAYVRAYLVTHARTEPPSVLNHGGGGENGPFGHGRITRCEHSRPTLTRPQNDRSATSMPHPIAFASTSALTQITTCTPKSSPRCC